MDSVYRIFVSASKQTLERERDSVNQAILLSHNLPISMEFFVSSNNTSTLKKCIDSINESDAVLLMLKERYGTYIKSQEVRDTFSDGCPLQKAGLCKGCKSQEKKCKYSYTHFEYLYAKHRGKIVYVLHKDSPVEEYDRNMQRFVDGIHSSGAYNIYTDEQNFDRESATIISRIIDDCKKDASLGLVPAKDVQNINMLQEQIAFLEDGYFDGLIPQKNYMGCIRTSKLVFYVYKEFLLRKQKHNIDFSIHINTANKNFDGSLTVETVNANAYVRYDHGSGFSDFHKCHINEKSYGREYLNCNIEFKRTDGMRLQIEPGSRIGIFYTYTVDEHLYGNEIGRKTSPFFEETVLEILNKGELSVECSEKRGFDHFLVEECMDDTQNSFLLTILKDDEFNKYIDAIYSVGQIVDYNLNQIRVPNISPKRIVHFYVKWEEI